MNPDSLETHPIKQSLTLDIIAYMAPIPGQLYFQIYTGLRFRRCLEVRWLKKIYFESTFSGSEERGGVLNTNPFIKGGGLWIRPLVDGDGPLFFQ